MEKGMDGCDHPEALLDAAGWCIGCTFVETSREALEQKQREVDDLCDLVESAYLEGFCDGYNASSGHGRPLDTGPGAKSVEHWPDSEACEKLKSIS